MAKNIENTRFRQKLALFSNIHQKTDERVYFMDPIQSRWHIKEVLMSKILFLNFGIKISADISPYYVMIYNSKP